MTETETLYRRASEAETMRRDGQSNPPNHGRLVSVLESEIGVLRNQRDAAEAVIIRLARHITDIGGDGMKALESARDALEVEMIEDVARRPMSPIEAMVTGMNKTYAAMHTPPDTHAECHEAVPELLAALKALRLLVNNIPANYADAEACGVCGYYYDPSKPCSYCAAEDTIAKAERELSGREVR